MLEARIVAGVVKRLRGIRTERKISIYRLSKETGLSKSGIRHMENGDVNPTLFFLLRISAYLQVDLEELIAEARSLDGKKPDG